MLDAIRESSPVVLITRVLIAAIVVFSTYNPSGKSIFHWVRGSLVDGGAPDAWVVLAAIVAVLVNVVLLIAAWKALGKIGVFIVLILFAAVVYLAFQEGWANASSSKSLTWLALILYSVFLGIGLSGAILWRRATGQVVTDEADDLEH